MKSKVTVLLLLAVATIGCDRVSKHIAVSTLVDEPRQSFLGDTLRLEYADNTGAFLGFGAGWPAAVRGAVFTTGNAALLLGLAIIAVRDRWTGLAAIGVTLFVSGGLSNVIDRATRGSVPDFLNIGVGPLRTGIFNVADIAIMLGVALVVLGKSARQTISDNEHK